MQTSTGFDITPIQLDAALTVTERTHEWATGFLAAVLSGPDLLPPSDWFNTFTPEAAFADADEAKFVLAALLHLYQHVGQVLQDDPASLVPDPGDVELMGEFCRGYYHGSTRHPSWARDQTASLRVVILGAIAGEMPLEDLEDPDGKPMSDEAIEEWLEHRSRDVGKIVRQLWEQWAPARRTAVRPANTKKPKTGPNEKCPCGSGKKYKKCCLA
jgi:uncharacterized protein